MKYYLLICFIALFATAGCQGQVPLPVDTPHVKTYKSLTDSAKAYVRQGDTAAAFRLHKKALLHAQRHRMQEHQAKSLMHMAKLLERADAGQSLGYLGHALQIAERLQKNELKADILLAMTSIYKQQQNYKASLATLEAHQKLLQSVFKKNHVQEIARIRAAESQQDERIMLVTIMLFLAITAGVFALYYRRTQRLNKALRQSNQIKDRLFSIIGHDLRGPAGVIMQALEMVDAGLLSENEQKEVIGLLRQQSKAFHETLNSLLTWAAAQLNGAEPHIASVDATTAIRKSLDLLNAQAIAKEVHITCPCEQTLSVLADRDQLDFVLRNLVSNAIKFSYPGGEIEISTAKQQDAALITVQDHGKGIPADQQAQLFAAGQLSSTFGTNGEKGTGLGLMLSWDFIKANRGRIWFDSKEGLGTTFYVSLPLAI